MSTQALCGSIEALTLLEVLAYIDRLKSTGSLNVTQGERKKSIIIHEGNIVFARSNLKADRMGDILLAKRHISEEQYQRAGELIREKGYRHGRALVEIRAISPKLLWTAIQDQIRTIAHSILSWRSGQFEFVQQPLKQGESITLRLPVVDFIIEAIRGEEDRNAFLMRFPDLALIYKKNDYPRDLLLKLEPFEDLILGRIDGETPLSEITRNGDLGVAESLRIVYLLSLLGFIESTGRRAIDEPESVHPLIPSHNKIFAYLNDYLYKKLGNVGTSLFKKYFEEVCRTHARVFTSVVLGEDGSLNVAELQRNVDALPENDRDALLEEALTELLYAGILVVKKALGTENETEVVQKIESLIESA